MPKPFTYEQVKEMIESEGYTLLSKEYVNTSTHLLVQCPHGHEPYPVTLRNWRKKRRCPYCSNHVQLTYEQVKAEIEKEEGYKLLSTSYKTTGDKLMIQCPHGHKFSMSLDNFRKGARCKYCNGGVQLEYDVVKANIEDEGYSLVDTEYINANTKLHLICPNGHDYYVTYNNFINQNNRCTECKHSHSKGEQAIINFFKDNSIEYLNEYSFKDCRSMVTNRPYPFDFYIPSLNTCIEYDGEQHYRPVKFGGISEEKAIENFNKTKERDNYKTTYCEQNGIELIRIPYFDYDKVDEILSQLIK